MGATRRTGPADGGSAGVAGSPRSEEHTSELQSQSNLVCRLLLEKKNDAGLTPTTSATASKARSRTGVAVSSVHPPASAIQPSELMTLHSQQRMLPSIPPSALHHV